MRHRQRDVVRRALPPELPEELVDLRRRVLAPAVLGEEISGEIPVQPGGAPSAVLELEGPAHVAAVDRLDASCRASSGRLLVWIDSAPPSVFSPNNGFDPGISVVDAMAMRWKKIPAHDFAERLVQPHAVHVDRQALRRAEQWGGRVAAIVDVRLKRVALDLVDVHAVQTPVEEVGEIQRAALRDVALGGRLDRRGNLLEWQLDAGQRRGFDDGHRVDRWRHGLGRRGILGCRLRRGAGRGLCPRHERRPREHDGNRGGEDQESVPAHHLLDIFAYVRGPVLHLKRAHRSRDRRRPGAAGAIVSR